MKIILTSTVQIRFQLLAYITAFYDVHVKVHTWRGDEATAVREYYDVQYSFIFHDADNLVELHYLNKKELHPLFNPVFPDAKLPEETGTPPNLDTKKVYCGMIVKNAFTTEMIRFLLMDNQSLSLVSGDMTHNRYRRNIMQALSYFANE